MKWLQAINLVTGKFLNRQHTYLTHSLNYSSRKRELNRNYLDYIRLSTLELAAHEINRKNIKGAVAEVGVYKGKFARFINQYFPERTLYLFDTFEGFDQKDISTEVNKGFSSGEQDFSETSVEKVLAIMPHADKCVIKKGYFPQTAEGLQETFAFVSLDTDLFDPIYNGLVYFYPRMTKGGYIFIHDFNNDLYKGARSAVEKYCEENDLSYLPLPDTCGTAVIIK